MNKLILFYSGWSFICVICLVLVEEASNYFSKEWTIKDVIKAIVLFPITLIILIIIFIFYLIEKFEETRLIQMVYKFLNKPIKNKE